MISIVSRPRVPVPVLVTISIGIPGLGICLTQTDQSRLSLARQIEHLWVVLGVTFSNDVKVTNTQNRESTVVVTTKSEK